MKKNRKKVLIWIISVSVALGVTVGGCAIYLSDYYPSDLAAISAFAQTQTVKKNVTSEGLILYGEADSEVGFIFYPGGKVEYTAYEPLMLVLASRGVFCVLVEMPFNLAVLDSNAADGIPDNYPEVDCWYIGGHSLGGSMAASYGAKNADCLEGIVLLGAYSVADLSETSLGVLSVYGSEDGVMDRDKYEKYKNNLPADLTEVEIEGGCHAYFGMYGEQKGDGVPSMTAEEQISISADHIMDFFARGDG